MSDIPQNAYILPDEKINYLAVWQTETKLVLRLLNGPKLNGHEFDIKLDKKILPHLVDALIDLQNKMRTDYPKDYKGPKAGLSDNQEWLEVTEFQAYKYMVFGTWKFSDFDCWLGAMKDWHYTRGGDDVKKAFEEMQRIVKIRD